MVQSVHWYTYTLWHWIWTDHQYLFIFQLQVASKQKLQNQTIVQGTVPLLGKARFQNYTWKDTLIASHWSTHIHSLCRPSVLICWPFWLLKQRNGDDPHLWSSSNEIENSASQSGTRWKSNRIPLNGLWFENKLEWQLNIETQTTSALVVEEAENLTRASEKQLKQCEAVILRRHVQ